jgi:hypothetical protein
MIRAINTFLLPIVFIGLLFLSGCASVKEYKNGTYTTETTDWWGADDFQTYGRRTNQKNADEKCSSQGKLVDPIQQKMTSQWDLILIFKCIDPSVKRLRELDAIEANKKEQERREKLAEEERKRNEEVRKKNEEERKKNEAEQKAEQKAKEAERLRTEALKAAEWERTRPQREAEQRRALAAEEARLNSICPTYFIARQTCAAAVWYSDCMKYRYGKNYSKSDDNTCFNR